MADEVLAEVAPAATPATPATPEIPAEGGAETPESTLFSPENADDGATDPAKTSDGKAGDGDTAEDGDTEPVEYDIKFPEGSEVDEEFLGEFKGLMQGMDLSQDQAQNLTDFYTNMQAKMQASQDAKWAKVVEGWKAEIKADPEIGGDNFYKITKPQVFAAIKEYGSDELRGMIENDPLFGDNIHLIRFFKKAGENLVEDQSVRGHASGGAGTQEELDRKMFPKSHNKDA